MCLDFEIIELSDNLIGVIIKCNGKSYYLPPIINDSKIPVPLKYRDLAELELFPEIVFVKYGRW